MKLNFIIIVLTRTTSPKKIILILVSEKHLLLKGEVGLMTEGIDSFHPHVINF